MRMRTQVLVVNLRLSGRHYYAWKRAMEIALGAKSKLGFVDETLVCPNPTNVLFGSWTRCNLVVQSWILSYFTPEIVQSILYEDVTCRKC